MRSLVSFMLTVAFFFCLVSFAPARGAPNERRMVEPQSIVAVDVGFTIAQSEAAMSQGLNTFNKYQTMIGASAKQSTFTKVRRGPSTPVDWQSMNQAGSLRSNLYATGQLSTTLRT